MPPPREPQKAELRPAWTALRALIRDPDRTEQVFELIRESLRIDPPERADFGGIIVS